jgi:MFS family permease
MQDESHRMTRSKWALLWLLIASIFLNYVDRSNLSVAAPVISTEFGLTPGDLGLMLSAFFWTYALLQLFGIAGWLADRFPVGMMLAAGVFVWSIATLAGGMVTGFTALFFTRLLLGAGESIAYPCYSRILAADIPASHRGRANALLDAGSKMGPALGTLAGGLLLSRIGWRPFFIVLGIVSLIWLLPWLRWMPRTGASAVRATEAGPPMSAIVQRRDAWGAFLGHFCGNYYWFFLVTWLPTYLVKERQFTIDGMATISSIAYFAIAAATVAAGWISDRWIASGASPTRVRKTIVVTGLLSASVLLPVAYVNDRNTSIALLFLACAGFGTYTSNHWAITQTLAGPLAAGRWTSLQNGIGNLSGIVASWFTGIVVERTHSFPLAFVAAAALAVLGAIFWGIVVGPLREIAWAKELEA